MATDERTNQLPSSASPTDHTDCPHTDVQQYEIRVTGHLGARWAAWFDGLSLTNEDDGTTAIRGPVVDQAALHGLLEKLRDLGVPLLSLTRIPNDASITPGPSSRRTERN